MHSFQAMQTAFLSMMVLLFGRVSNFDRQRASFAQRDPVPQLPLQPLDTRLRRTDLLFNNISHVKFTQFPRKIHSAVIITPQ